MPLLKIKMIHALLTLLPSGSLCCILHRENIKTVTVQQFDNNVSTFKIGWLHRGTKKCFTEITKQADFQGIRAKKHQTPQLEGNLPSCLHQPSNWEMQVNLERTAHLPRSGGSDHTPPTHESLNVQKPSWWSNSLCPGGTDHAFLMNFWLIRPTKAG